MTQNTFHGKIDRNVVTIGRKNMGKKDSYYEDNDNDLFDMIKLKYPNSYECVKRIEGFIKQKYCTQLTKEEMLYLIIHTARVVHENC